jgi:hypothetical protein
MLFDCRVLFWDDFSSTEWFRTEFREFISIFGSTERNSGLCSLPQNGSEQNYGSLLRFLFHGTEFRVISSSAEGFGTEFRDFLFRGTTGIPSEITLCSVYSVFRWILFLSEIPNPTNSPKTGSWQWRHSRVASADLPAHYGMILLTISSWFVYTQLETPNN